MLQNTFIYTFIHVMENADRKGFQEFIREYRVIQGPTLIYLILMASKAIRMTKQRREEKKTTMHIC